MGLTAKEMISLSGSCTACDLKKTGIVLDDDERYETCDSCGGPLTDHQARLQRMDDRGVWKEAGPLRWAGGRWVSSE